MPEGKIRSLAKAIVSLLFATGLAWSQGASCPAQKSSGIDLSPNPASTDLCDKVYRINCNDALASTGFLASVNDKIGLVTALHGVANCNGTISAKNSSPRIDGLQLSLVDFQRDVAFLTSTNLLTNAFLAAQTNPPAGGVRVLGYPEGSGLQWDFVLTLRPGGTVKLSDVLNDDDRIKLFQRKSPDIGQLVLAVTGDVQPGLSGAPILTEDGQVLAIADGGLGLGSAVGWAIPYSFVQWKPLDPEQKIAVAKLVPESNSPLASYAEKPAGVKTPVAEYRPAVEKKPTEEKPAEPALYYADARKQPGAIYLLRNGKSTQVFERPSGQLYSVAVSRNGDIFYCNANQYQVYRIQNGRETVIYNHQTYVRDVGFDPGGHLYFSESFGGGADGKIYRLDLKNQTAGLFRAVQRSEVGGFWAGDFAFDPNGTLWVSRGNSRPASLYKLVGDRFQQVFSSAGAIVGIAFGRDGSFVYTDMNSIFTLNLRSMKVAQIYQAPSDAWVWGVTAAPANGNTGGK